MSAAEQLSPLYMAAAQFGMRGLRLLPVESHSRSAILNDWPHNATNDVSLIDRWFETTGNNLGLCCGPQPSGWNILCVDIDDQEAWQQLEAQHGKIDRETLCYHRTPSNGLHLFFDVPTDMAVTGTNVFGPGIDARGGRAGNVGCGYVLLPPSVAPSKLTGELLSYGASPGKGLLDRDPPKPPEWLLRHIDHHLNPPLAASIARHPSQERTDGDDPWSWVRNNIRWEDKLIEHGWQPSGGPYWTRPGKSVRDGHSAQLHDDGRLAVWTGEIPNTLRDLGARQSDGGVSISLADFICAYEFNGDRAEFGRSYRKKMPPPGPAGVGGPTTEAVLEASATALAIERMCLPEWFWQQRPWLTHIRDSAWAVGSVPEALLAAVLGRIATMCSPRWLIPAIVEDEATFDLITVIVGHSGTGKSGPMRRAKKVLPCSYPKLRFGLGISSGEGILEAYYGMVETENAEGKKSKERGKAYDGVHFTVDEGKLFTGLGDRNGWTGIDRILTAWSGGDLSTPNAKQENFRHIEAGTYRFALTLAIQADQASDLWSADNLTQGFTGRLTMLSGLSTTVPDRLHRPADPGPLKLALPPVGYPRILSFPEAFEVEVQDAHHAKRSLINDPDPLSGHRNLQRAKLAGMMALAEGRFDVEESDIALATAIVDASDVIRTWLMQRAVAVRVANDQAMAEARGRSTAVQQQATDKALLGDTVDFVGAKLRLRDMSRKELRGTLTRSKLDYLDSALQLLEDMGKVSGGRGAKWHWTG